MKKGPKSTVRRSAQEWERVNAGRRADRGAILGVGAALLPAQLCHAAHGNDAVPCVAFLLLNLTAARDLVHDRADALAFLALDPPLNLRRLRLPYDAPLTAIVAALLAAPHHKQLREFCWPYPVTAADGEAIVGALDGAASLRRVAMRGAGHLLVARAAAATLRSVAFQDDEAACCDMAPFGALRRLESDHCRMKIGLTAATLPPSLRVIGASAFYACTKLTKLDLSGLTQLRHIGDNFCTMTPLLLVVDLPPSVATIGCGCFAWCGIAVVDFSALTRLTSIGVEFCQGCTGITRTLLPPNVTHIGELMSSES
jgi:hypothetical protein